MRFEDWPEADQAAWVDMFKKGHLLDEAGTLSHYRAPSITKLRNSYSYWLSWIRAHDEALLVASPQVRITADRLVAWRNANAHLAPHSVSTLLQSLGIVLHAFDPHRPSRQERAVINQAKQRAEWLGSERKRGRIVDTSVLLDAGLQHFCEHFPSLADARLAPVHCRDGVMIAMLALMPMRRRPFLSLELGRSIQRGSEGWTVALSEEDLKRGECWESPVPLALHEALAAYVDHVRPMLAGSKVVPHNDLWLTLQGCPVDDSHFGVRMKKLTLRLIGRDISCHLFRDCAATTLALKSPKMARLTKSLLGHSTDRTATRYYNQATSIEVGRLLERSVMAIKRKL